jgi:hypothetical protein
MPLRVQDAAARHEEAICLSGRPDWKTIGHCSGHGSAHPDMKAAKYFVPIRLSTAVHPGSRRTTAVARLLLDSCDLEQEYDGCPKNGWMASSKRVFPSEPKKLAGICLARPQISEEPAEPIRSANSLRAKGVTL